jgi:hypothetical protein
MGKINSCNKCTKRWVNDTTNCHASCPKYLEEVERNEREKEIIRKEKEISNAYNEIMRGLSKKR